MAVKLLLHRNQYEHNAAQPSFLRVSDHANPRIRQIAPPCNRVVSPRRGSANLRAAARRIDPFVLRVSLVCNTRPSVNLYLSSSSVYSVESCRPFPIFEQRVEEKRLRYGKEAAAGREGKGEGSREKGRDDETERGGERGEHTMEQINRWMGNIITHRLSSCTAESGC